MASRQPRLNLENIVPPEPPPLPGTPTYEKALDELDEFKKDAASRAHRRRQNILDHIHQSIIYLIWFVGICIIVLITVRTVHLLIPERCGWLSTSQIEVLNSLARYAASGAVGALSVKFLSKNIESL